MCRNENKIIDLGKMIQWIKTLHEMLTGNFITTEVQATDKPPDVTQYEKVPLMKNSCRKR